MLFRSKLGIQKVEKMLLSLSRILYIILPVLAAFAQVSERRRQGEVGCCWDGIPIWTV